MIVSTTGIIILYVLIGIFAAGSASLVFIFMFTPASVFLRAWLKKLPVILNVGREQTGEFVLGKMTIGSIMKTKSKGIFFATKGSHILERKSRAPLFIAHSEYCGTLPYDLMQKIDVLSRKAQTEGVPLNTFEEYQAYLQHQGTTYKDDKGIEHTTEALKIFENVTFSLHDLPKFQYNLDPTFVERNTENEKLIMQKSFFNRVDTKVLVIGGFILLCAGIAVLLIFKGFQMYQGPSCPPVEIIMPTVKNVASNMTEHIMG